MTVIAPVEGDGIAMAVASEHMIQQGAIIEGLAYRYSFQPGVYVLLSRIGPLSGMDCYVLFSVACSAAFFIFIICSSLLVCKLTGYSMPVCIILALILFPQTYCEGCYPNSTILAASCGMIAFLLLKVGRIKENLRLLLAAILTGLASFFRLDFSIMVLALFPLLEGENSSIRIFKFIKVVSITACFTMMLMVISGAHISDLLLTCSSHLTCGKQEFNLKIFRNLMIFIEFFPACTVVLFLLGIAHCIEKRKTKLLSISLLGFLPLWFCYANALNSPKYLYYSIPFLLIVSLEGITFILKLRQPVRKMVTGFLLLAMLLQLIVGVNIELRNRPWRLTRSPKYTHLYDIQLRKGPIANIGLYLGVGSDWPSDDAPSFPFGSFWSPLALYNEKVQSAKSIKALKRYFSSPDGPSSTLFCTTWIGSRATMLALVQSGYYLYLYTKEKQIWRKDKHEIFLFFQENYERKADLLLQRMLPSEKKNDFILVTGLPREIYLLNNSQYIKEVIHKPEITDGKIGIFRVGKGKSDKNP